MIGTYQLGGMNGPSAARLNDQEARGGKPRGSTRWVRIVNQVRNQSPVIRRKDANRLVALKRAEWVAADQIRLVLSHPANRRDATMAAIGYEWPAGKIITRRELRNIPIVNAAEALKHQR